MKCRCVDDKVLFAVPLLPFRESKRPFSWAENSPFRGRKGRNRSVSECQENTSDYGTGVCKRLIFGVFRAKMAFFWNTRKWRRLLSEDFISYFRPTAKGVGGASAQCEGPLSSVERLNENTSPPLGLFFTRMEPWWRSTAFFTMASPRPVPPILRLRPLSTL